MKISKTYILTITLTFIFIAVGFFLPEWIISYTDQSIIGKVEIESVDLPKVISGNDISMIEKISLLQDYPQNVDRVALNMGTNFNLTSASDQFLMKLQSLQNSTCSPKQIQMAKEPLKWMSAYMLKKMTRLSVVYFGALLYRKTGFREIFTWMIIRVRLYNLL